MTKKIMFSDRFGLTAAVLSGKKTMTRRVITNKNALDSLYEQEYMKQLCIDYSFLEKYSRYQIGEVIAIAQSYKDLGFSGNEVYRDPKTNESKGNLLNSPAWNNKMFVRAEACKHHIRITNIRIERLQDITDEDCLREGILKREIRPFNTIEIKYQVPLTTIYKDTPREAFANLIDKVSKKGTWNSNSFVFVYEFELVD